MKKHVLVICIFTVLCLLFNGCSNNDSISGQLLNLSAETAEDSYIHISTESLNYNFDTGISYFGIKNPTIMLDNETFALETAISEGKITVEEIWAYAMIDARNGFCAEEGHSHNGLSYFIYHYPGVCDLYFSHDVYETPSGKSYITNHFNVYAYNQGDNIYYIPTEYDENGNPYPADIEDWKLTFKIDNITSSGFDIQIYQPDISVKNYRSHHIGELHLVNFRLEYLNTEIPEEIIDLQHNYFQFPQENTLIEQDTVNTFSITQAEIEGFPASLPSGAYQICLTIRDVFDEEDVHPLMVDYHQDQTYWIQFDIP